MWLNPEHSQRWLWVVRQVCVASGSRWWKEAQRCSPASPPSPPPHTDVMHMYLGIGVTGMGGLMVAFCAHLRHVHLPVVEASCSKPQEQPPISTSTGDGTQSALSPGYPAYGGLFADQAIQLLQDFYVAGNPLGALVCAKTTPVTANTLRLLIRAAILVVCAIMTAALLMWARCHALAAPKPHRPLRQGGAADS